VFRKRIGTLPHFPPRETERLTIGVQRPNKFANVIDPIFDDDTNFYEGLASVAAPSNQARNNL
jgi:hypothetical protein